MRRTLGGALVLALLAAACGSSPPPTSPPATPAASAWDPRLDAIEQHEGIWARHEPVAYAYDLDHEGDGQAWRYHVSGLEGGAQVQHVSGGAVPDADLGGLTIDGVFDRARSALASEAFRIAFDDLAGNPTSLTFASAADPAAGGASETVDGFHASTRQGEVARAQAALEAVLQRWRAVDDARWSYAWSRIPAGASTAQPVTWTVSHARGRTSAKPVAAGDLNLTPDDVGIEGTVLAVQNVLVSGGWADVAVEDDPGHGVLIAVDPKPGARGDAYWIRITWMDLAREASVSDLEAAKARWATAQLTDYSYTWEYRGEGDPLTYKVTRKGGKDTVTRAGKTPAAQPAWATPRIEDTFAMIDAVLADGGSVDASYDEQLGYPTRIEMHPDGDAGANGVVTIKALKRR
jgi:hypothetical protein